MAINVNVPGVGNISVEGAASEQTLQSLVNAINGTNTRQQRNAADMGADLKSAGDSAADTAAALKETANSSKQAKSAIAQMASSMSESIVAATGQYQVSTSTVGEFAQNLLATSTQISREWTRAFVSLANGGLDPISTSANTFKAGIDAASTVIGGMSKILGPVAGGLARTFAALGAAVGKTGIDLLKDQLVGAVRAMERFNKTGAIFSEGIGEMMVTTGKTGLTFDQLSRVVQDNRDNIKAFGGTLADGVKQLADVTSSMAESVDSSGNTVRKRLLNLGISLEEQTAIAASYMAQQRTIAGVEKIRGQSSKEVAEATAKYAVDLKVLQELTGKDAKAIADKAAKDTMRASVMSKLDLKQQQSMQATIRGLSSLGPEGQAKMQDALTRYILTGTFDPSIALDSQMTGYVEQLGKGVLAGSADMQNTTTKASEELRTELAEKSRLNQTLATTTDTMAALQIPLSGAVQGYQQLTSAILSNTTLSAGATQKASEQANNLMNTTDKLQNSVSNMTAESAKITSAFINISTQALPSVAPAIEGLVTGVAKAAKKLESVVVGKTSTDQFLTDLKTGVVDVWKSASQAIKQTLDEYFGVRRPAAAPGATPSRGRGTLGETGNVTEPKDIVAKLHMGETVLTEGQFKNLVMGVSGATMGKAVAQPALNSPQNSGMDTIGASDSIKQIQNLYSAAMRDITLEKARAEAQKPSDKTSTDIPEEFTNALGKFNIIPLSTSIDNLAQQVNTSSTDQQSLLTQQIDKLSQLVSAMQDSVRYNERIANELG